MRVYERLSRRPSIFYLGLALIVVFVATLLAVAGEIEPGWAVPALILIIGVMIAHDARSRGMSMLWGVFALTAFGALLYLIRISRRPPDNLAH